MTANLDSHDSDRASSFPRRAAAVTIAAALALPLGSSLLTATPNDGLAQPAQSGARTGDGQPAGGTPVMTLAGPQGIGIRAEPVPADAPRFEAASIRRDRSGQMPPPSQGQLVFVRGNRVTANNITVRELIRNGYNYQHVPRSFVADGPAWIDEERYNLEAVAAEPIGPVLVRNVPPPEAAAMIRSLLVDRFELELHNETREERIYELVLDRADGRLGPNLTPAQPTCLGPFDLVDLSTTSTSLALGPDGRIASGDGKPYFCPFMLSYGPRSRLMTGNMRMQDLAMFLGLMPSINTGVVDRTGLTGRYDIDLEFAAEMVLSPNSAPLPTGIVDTELPTLAGALRQQFGLRLESTRGPVEVLVIDRVGRPSEN